MNMNLSGSGSGINFNPRLNEISIVRRTVPTPMVGESSSKPTPEHNFMLFMQRATPEQQVNLKMIYDTSTLFFDSTMMNLVFKYAKSMHPLPILDVAEDVMTLCNIAIVRGFANNALGDINQMRAAEQLIGEWIYLVCGVLGGHPLQARNNILGMLRSSVTLPSYPQTTGNQIARVNVQLRSQYAPPPNDLTNTHSEIKAKYNMQLESIKRADPHTFIYKPNPTKVTLQHTALTDILATVVQLQNVMSQEAAAQRIAVKPFISTQLSDALNH